MMAVQVYGCNHIVIEVINAKKAVQFYSDVFGLTMLRGGEGAAKEPATPQPDLDEHRGVLLRRDVQRQRRQPVQGRLGQ